MAGATHVALVVSWAQEGVRSSAIARSPWVIWISTEVWLSAAVLKVCERLGGFVVLSALLVLLSFGVARRGFFKGDLFVAAAVVGCGSLLALFIVFPVLKALSAEFFLEDGPFSLAVVWRGTRCSWG